MERLKNWYSDQAEKLALLLIKQGIVPEKDKVIYQYGIAQIGYLIFYILTYFIIGMITGNPGMLWWYLLCFTVLRVSAGGFHMKKRHTCYLMTTGCIFLISWVLKQETVMVSIVWQIILGAASCAIIWRIAPIDTPNRRVDDVEYKVYKRRTRIILLSEVIVYLLTQIVGMERIAFAVFIAVFQEMIFLCLGKREASDDK